ncbi:MAG: VWA domain-containing protein, partial [Acidobacteriota bacterium]
DAERPRLDIDLGLQIRRSVDQRSRQAFALDREPPPPAHDLPEIEADLVEPILAPSDHEILRYKDFATLTDEERRQILALLDRQPLRWPPRRTRRQRPSRHGSLDLRRTIRRSLTRGGEPVELLRRRRVVRPRPLVALLDVSGSMEAYARILLQWLYTLRCATDRLEVFVFGTRLTRITRELRTRDVDRALRDATSRVRDWGGGTRIGEAFRTFNHVWGRRVLGRGAVVMVLSDAWDRGEPEILDFETGRLARHTRRLMWLNPLLGSVGYEPTATGIATVLPHVDDFLPVHDLRSLQHLADVLERLDRTAY